MKTFENVIAESTCQKRVTVCELYDWNGMLLCRESNRCNPDGICCRLGVIQNKDNYDKNSNCNWTHAEIMAISALPKHLSGGIIKPHKAIVYGHDFICDSCEEALKDAGVEELIIESKLKISI